MEFKIYRRYRQYKPTAKPKTKRKHKLKIKGHGIFGTALKKLWNLFVTWFRWKMRRKKITFMRKLDMPKRVTLPNDGTFLVRYKRVERSELLPNIIMNRTYT